jgi:hypothetical protein
MTSVNLASQNLSTSTSTINTNFTESVSLRIIEKTDDHTLETTDFDGRTLILMNDPSDPATITIPDYGTTPLPIGHPVTIVLKSTDPVTFDPDGSATLVSRNSEVSLTEQWATATLIQLEANVWLLAGALATV